MSKRKSTSNANTNATYDSDGGFVEDAPRSKKAKKGTSAASAVNDGGSNGKGEGKGGDMKMNKKKKGAAGGREAGKEVGMEVVGGGQVGRDGEEFWEVGWVFLCFVCFVFCVGLGWVGWDGWGGWVGLGWVKGEESGWRDRMWGLGNWLTLRGGVCS